VLKRLSLLLLALILATFVLTGCSETARSQSMILASNQQQGIWVNGQGKVSVSPDVAVIALGVQAQDITVASAQKIAADAMNNIIVALNSNGIADRDIQTHQYSIQVVTKYDDSQQRDVVIGYLVTNAVTAKVRTLESVGAVIDAASAAGGDFVRIDGLSFSIEDPTQLNAQAREKAIIDAKIKAEQIAKLSETKLGKPTFISESVTQPTPVPVKAGTSGGTPISPGQLDIVASVQVVYQILQ